MKIAIIGLGLIGSSIARALSQRTSHEVTGYDMNREVVSRAIADGVISGEANLSDSDIVILAIYPHSAIEYVENHLDELRDGVILTDCVGVKRAIMEPIARLCEGRGIRYVGGHPMAGKERGGYPNGSASMLERAYMLLVGEGDALEILREMYTEIGMRVRVTTADEHDRIISYTSQLAHIVSGAYVMSDTSYTARGFSAGSFKDMTRVARLNEDMWTELMMMNGDYLATELTGLIDRLTDYRDAIETKDSDALRRLLAKGRRIKEEIDRW